MKTGSIIAIIAAVALVAFGIFFFDVEQTEEASLPEVDVTVEGGNAPEFDVEAGDIETGTEEVTVTVPTIDVESPEEERTASN
ncbi:hypothetical protein GQ651_09695 [Alphaproteobacteria bacterium GH1-50]|uniref:Uncharacterized protein n=1 Tax=Kangsaoukella pontilimi TaxID=2691042 RepID=A0A7C9MX41_9RHOB|nr:hypothetical protein [Kangsaoukella pontilimi]MXQ08114.1 hypothetical protein [Kangsaoukella pontilimi]